jgi:transposase
MAKAAGISHRSVQRIWAAHELKPHRVRTFKLSKDPKFVDKVLDVVGLYVDPPEHALVLSVDEKSQIQALDRSQPGLPMKKGRCGTMTHDYKRHGTTTLFAALNVLEGKVIGQCMARHRHQEFIRFLNRINREIPAGRELHLIVDNYATHKHPKVRAWLARHPRFHFHFTPKRIDRRIGLEKRKCLIAIPRPMDDVSTHLQRHDGNVENLGVVIDDQHYGRTISHLNWISVSLPAAS